jgi:heme oxygenase
LKAATSTAHLRLDALVASGGFLTDRPRYLGYLRATLRARDAAECGLDAAGAALVFAAWPARRIASALRDDIRDLDPGARFIEAPPLAFASPAAALGGLYVLEGSALGARLLAARAADMGLSRDFGARHMGAQIEPATAWRSFVGVLDAAVLTPADEDACAAGAMAVFRCFARELADASVPT